MFECVGVPGMVQASIDAAGVHGKVVIVGVCSKPDPFVPVVALMKELTMHFVVYYRSADYRYTIDMMQQAAGSTRCRWCPSASASTRSPRRSRH